MLRNGDLPAIKVGGRGQWRVEQSVLEEYIAKAYADAAAWVRGHPLVRSTVTAGAALDRLTRLTSPSDDDARGGRRGSLVDALGPV